VNNFIRESQPNNVVVELCDERFNNHYNAVMKHPKYEAIIEKFYKILDDEEKVKKLGQKSDLIELKEMEYLLGVDICSFRIPRCRSILGDRNWSITQKRLRAKLRLSDLLTEEEDFGISHLLAPQNKEETKEEADQIQKLLDQTNIEDDEEEEFDFQKAQEIAIKEDHKTDEQIYEEVIIDEVNGVLLKNINK